ncbi:hypothetical protein FB45DRAFT_872050 [Roridomyces roridus]|uniref:Uncharacterized protein n=1 Tax=Roridomyces roridus TaxID=1738132 RepID=A0AAD7FE64_9AGAR|nr:hypothetical protein FB45DRAFT_872050 [Roridomyces roridus]
MAESAECYPKGNKPTKPQHHNTNYQNIQHPSQGQSTSTTVEFGVTLNFSNKSSDRLDLFQEAYCKALYSNTTQGLKTQVLEPVREVDDPSLGSGTSIECCEYSRHFTREYEYSYSRTQIGNLITGITRHAGMWQSLRNNSIYLSVTTCSSGGTITKLRNQLSEQSAHSTVMVSQWASDLDLIAVDEFEKQLAEGWTQNKKWKAPAAAEASGSVRVIVIDDDST